MKRILKKLHLPLAPLALLLITSATASAWYDPGVQRWITRDPVGEAGFEALPARSSAGWLGFDPAYVFVANRPVDQVDPFGLAVNDPPPCAPYPDCLHHQPPPPPGRPPTCKERENLCRARALIVCAAGSIISGCGPLAGGACLAVYLEYCHEKYHDSCVNGHVLAPWSDTSPFP
jgi:hypothetical protein